ncbi:MAG: hypothetical protein CM1200mP34_0920 [Verrucomicrobiales bacterium]|nr:MAG: hypothetical protein CM1200mP34_0920 [Verrucomicrobiales bacterium]
MYRAGCWGAGRDRFLSATPRYRQPVARSPRAGELPFRITHNDTKIDNVPFDRDSGEVVCIVDLDTVMPGLVHYDFGDMMRTSPARPTRMSATLSR